MRESLWLMDSILIRAGNECTDLSDVTFIYSTYVNESIATFELPPAPAQEEMGRRLRAVNACGRGAWIVAVEVVNPPLDASANSNSSKVVGYAYAKQYRERAGYYPTAEHSIYLDRNYRRRGIGRLLLSALVKQCRENGFEQMLAVIGGDRSVPSYLFHRQYGFREVGYLENVGRKFGKLVPVTFLQLDIRNHHHHSSSSIKRDEEEEKQDDHF